MIVTSRDLLFNMPSKNTLMKTALGLCERLFVTNDTEPEPPDEGTESEEESQNTVSLQAHLQQEIDACMRSPDPEEKTGNDLQKILSKEFALYEATKVRPENLQRLYMALLAWNQSEPFPCVEYSSPN